jgi:hypothetical protein
MNRYVSWPIPKAFYTASLLTAIVINIYSLQQDTRQPLNGISLLINLFALGANLYDWGKIINSESYLASRLSSNANAECIKQFLQISGGILAGVSYMQYVKEHQAGAFIGSFIAIGSAMLSVVIDLGSLSRARSLQASQNSLAMTVYNAALRRNGMPSHAQYTQLQAETV